MRHARPVVPDARGQRRPAWHSPSSTPHDTQVLIVAAIGIAIIVALIVWLKLHAFLALTIGALFVGVGSGIPLGKVTASYETGVGGVLGYVGVLIALGAMLGKLLADSGGADKVVDTLLRGRPATLPWKMALIAAIIGIPMFFEIGLVLLIPVVMLAVHRSKGPAMRLGIPALAGLSVLHGFIPPHPGPLAAIAHPARQRRHHAGAGSAGRDPRGRRSRARCTAWSPRGWCPSARPARASPCTQSRDAGAKTAGERRRTRMPTRSPVVRASIMATLLFPLVLMLVKAGADIWLRQGLARAPAARLRRRPGVRAAGRRAAGDGHLRHRGRLLRRPSSARRSAPA